MNHQINPETERCRHCGLSAQGCALRGASCPGPDAPGPISIKPAHTLASGQTSDLFPLIIRTANGRHQRYDIGWPVAELGREGAKRLFGESLETLAARGGLSPLEMMCAIAQVPPSANQFTTDQTALLNMIHGAAHAIARARAMLGDPEFPPRPPLDIEPPQ